jgi:prevent-host-death family protein
MITIMSENFAWAWFKKENKTVTVTSHGHPVAVVVPYHDYKQLQANIEEMKNQIEGL